jgi:Spy/CpxP family protein refolding chaperone
MNNRLRVSAYLGAFVLGIGTLALGVAWPLAGIAQDKPTDPPPHQHTDKGKSADTDKPLAEQLRELQAKVAKLEAALKQAHQAPVAATPGGAGGMGGMPIPGKQMGMGSGMMEMDSMMGAMAGKKGMGGMDMGKGGLAQAGPMPGMGMMDEDTDMMGMMGKGGMGAKGMRMKMAAALPGFPGASHIYHIGATGFFLDLPEHVTLTTEQQAKLNRVKQKALLDKSKAQREIDEAEQELWELTGADEPDAAQIQAKIQEVEKLHAGQRLAFIRSVGEAAKVLTDEQRQVLLGTAKPEAHKDHKPSGP